MSWHKQCQSHNESAIQTVRLIVAMFRSPLATERLSDDQRRMPVAQERAARALGITPRRVRSLFHREEGRIVLANEWYAIRVRAAAAMRREADALRERAEQYEAEAEALDSAQPSLWGDAWDHDSKPRCSA